MGGLGPRLAQVVETALRPYLCLVPAVILKRSEGSKRDYEGNAFAVFTYDGSPIVQSGMREPSL